MIIDRAVSRSRTEIIGQMLEIANNITDEIYRGNRNTVSKLKMMYKGFLPHDVLVEHLSLLLENELLTHRKYERRNRIAEKGEKGKRFLRLYTELTQLISGKQEDQRLSMV
jgi:predicted transcriptional regulator